MTAAANVAYVGNNPRSLLDLAPQFWKMKGFHKIKQSSDIIS